MLVAVLWKAALQPISMKNIELHKTELSILRQKLMVWRKNQKFLKIFLKIVFQKGPADSY